MKDMFLDFFDYIKYDLLSLPVPPSPMVDMNLTLKVIKEKKGGYWVISEKYPGLVASGDTYEELREALYDALLTYFDVPRYIAKKSIDALTITLSDGTKILPPTPSHAINAKLVGA